MTVLAVLAIGSWLPIWTDVARSTFRDAKPAHLWNILAHNPQERRLADSSRELLSIHRGNVLIAIGLLGVASIAGIVAFRLSCHPEPEREDDEWGETLAVLVALRVEGCLLTRHGASRSMHWSNSRTVVMGDRSHMDGTLDRLIVVKRQLAPARSDFSAAQG